MKLKVRSSVSYSCGCEPCTLVFNVEAAQLAAQTLTSEVFSVTPGIAVEAFAPDSLGNRFTRCHLPGGGEFRMTYKATLETSHETADPASLAEIPPAERPPSVLPYTSPSRYCESDQLTRVAQIEFGHRPPGFGRVLAICDWITERVEYRPGSTDSQTSALDTLTELSGVCRDFAHLGIAFCRALDVPARFVSVYALDLEPQDFHAVFEAYLGDRWWLFDPTRLVALDSLVRIGTGRDATDVSFATNWGMAEMVEQYVRVERVDGLETPWDGSPVSQL